MKNNLSSEDILNMINTEKDVIVIDIRDAEEYRTNHFIGSINIPIDEIESVSKFIPFKSTFIFVYCSSGIISEDAKSTLKKMGYRNVFNMGGIYKYTNNLFIL